MRKFERLDAFPELGASKWRTWWRVILRRRLGPGRVELLKLAEAPDTALFRRAVSKPMLKTLSCWCSLGSKSSETDEEACNRKITRA